MSFLTAEQSQHNSKPIELYHFFRDSQNFYFTSSDKSVTYLGNKYIPQSIIRSNIKQASEISRTDIKISITTLNPFFKEIQLIYPKKVFSVKIYRLQKEENEALKIFEGFIQQTTYYNKLKVEITCHNISKTLRKNSLRYSFQNKCNNTIYGNKCTLIIDNYTDLINIENISDDGLTIYSSDLVQRDFGYYRAGIAIFDGDYRNITKHDNNDIDNAFIILDKKIEKLKIGDVLKATYGCKYSSSGCKKVNNFKNYFGFEYIPTENPYTQSIT